MRFCLVEDRRPFQHAFLPCRSQSAILTCVFALKRSVGHFNMRFSYVEDSRLFLHAFLPC